MNFNHLYYFYIVAKNGSIKACSEKLHVSQPTVSDQIKLLEEFLECRLFERRNRGLHLTPEGKLALEYCEKVFDLSQELTTRLRQGLQTPRTSLEIGITHFMSQYFIYETILPLFEQEDLAINIHQNKRHRLIADLEQGQVDIVFTDNKESLSSTMSAYRVGLNKTFVIAHKKYQKLKKDFPDCLNSIPFFNYTNQSFLKHEIDLFFSKNSLTPRIIGEADDIELFKVVTEKGLAFCIVPEVAKNNICQSKDVIVLGELKELQTSVWGITKNTVTGPAQKFLKSLNK